VDQLARERSLAKCPLLTRRPSLGVRSAAANVRILAAEEFNAADNPTFTYKQVACPAAITQKSGLSDPG